MGALTCNLRLELTPRKKMRRRLTQLLATSALLAAGHNAQADEAAAAEALFNAGLDGMKAGKFEEACPKISESFRLEARAGTLFTLAECWRKAGKTASALARYDEYLRGFERMNKKEKKAQRGRDKFARQHSEALEKIVPRLTVRLPKDAPADASVERNGVRIGAPALGLALPVDPGKHVLVASAPNGSRAELSVEIKSGERKDVTVELSAPDTSAAASPVPSAAPVSGPTESPSKDTASDGQGQRTTGLVLMGVGAAGLAVGAVTGLMVLGKKSSIQDNCGIGGDETACNADGKSEADSAQTLALISTIGFGVGIAGVGAGATLFLTAPTPSTAGRVSPAGASVTLRGAF